VYSVNIKSFKTYTKICNLRHLVDELRIQYIHFFVYFGSWLTKYSFLLRPVKNVSLSWRRPLYRWRIEKSRPMLGARAFEQGGIFIVSHLYSLIWKTALFMIISLVQYTVSPLSNFSNSRPYVFLKIWQGTSSLRSYPLFSCLLRLATKFYIGSYCYPDT
jgi:hypothetical protein